MRRIFWIFIAIATLFLTGCIELEEDLGQACSADRFCGPEMEPVCGADGKTYDCAPLAQCENVAIDPSGAACENPISCNVVTCEIDCEFGFATDEDGCTVCECKEPPVSCPDIQCDLDCIEGYKLDENGCQTCECREPPTECPAIQCVGDCPHGLKTDENGCEICECKEAPAICESDPCIAFECGAPQTRCMRQSEAATMGACAPVDFQEPAPQCVCTEDDCLTRDCRADADCPGADGLCVVTFEDEAGDGYCVNATCEDLREPYQELDPKFSTCEQDSDCRIAAAPVSCCDYRFVNEAGAEYLSKMNRFVRMTSCGAQWAQPCAMIDCAQPPEPACVQGVCQVPAP